MSAIQGSSLRWLLLVEDNFEHRYLIGRVLTGSGGPAQGIEVRSAETVEGAQDLLDAHGAPALAVLDINLPDGTGFDVMESARELGPVPVVFVSALQLDGADADGADALLDLRHSAPPTAFLTKPVDLVALKAVVADMLDERHGTLTRADEVESPHEQPDT